MKRMKTSLLTVFFFLSVLNFNVKGQELMKTEDNSSIFPKGPLASAEYFTGNVWMKDLVSEDPLFKTVAGNVEFEAGARTNWHFHPGGQIFFVTDGVGYHQIKGQAPQIIKKGDVIKCPPGVTHWHGASKDKSMTHLYILPNADSEKGTIKWLNKVTDEEYKIVK